MYRAVATLGLVALVGVLIAAPAWAEDELPSPPAAPAAEAEGDATAPPPVPVAEPAPCAAPSSPTPCTAPPRAMRMASVPPPRMWRRSPRWSGSRRRTCFLFRAEAGIGCIQDPEGRLGAGSGANVPPFDWGQIECDLALAARVTLGYRFTPCDLAELRGTLFGSWTEESRQTGQFPFRDRTGVSPTATATLESDADMWTGELNWWRDFGGACGWRWHGGLGARYLRFDDTATVRNWVGLAPTSFLASDVENTVFAGQVLAALTYSRRCWVFEGSARVFLGSINRRVRIDEDSILSGGVKAAESEVTEFGWGFELGLDARYRLSPCFSLTAGYSLLFLGEAVRGHDAMDFTQAATGAVQARQVTDNVVAMALLLGFQIDL